MKRSCRYGEVRIGVPTQHLLKGPRKTTENLGRVGRSQDLPEGEIPATCSSTYSTVHTSQKAHSVSIK
jgi:hypothetical protein